MGKAHCSNSKFFEKDILNPFQVNVSFLPPPSLRRLENFSNTFRFQEVLELNTALKRIILLQELYLFEAVF